MKIRKKIANIALAITTILTQTSVLNVSALNVLADLDVVKANEAYFSKGYYPKEHTYVHDKAKSSIDDADYSSWVFMGYGSGNFVSGNDKTNIEIQLDKNTNELVIYPINEKQPMYMEVHGERESVSWSWQWNDPFKVKSVAEEENKPGGWATRVYTLTPGETVPMNKTIAWTSLLNKETNLEEIQIVRVGDFLAYILGKDIDHSVKTLRVSTKTLSDSKRVKKVVKLKSDDKYLTTNEREELLFPLPDGITLANLPVLTINGKEYKSNFRENNTLLIDQTNLEDGIYDAMLEWKDASSDPNGVLGRVYYDDTHKIMIDRTPPAIDLTDSLYQVDDKYYINKTRELLITAKDISNCKIRVYKEKPHIEVKNAVTPFNSFKMTLDAEHGTDQLADMDYIIEATDEAGNKTSTTLRTLDERYKNKVYIDNVTYNIYLQDETGTKRSSTSKSEDLILKIYNRGNSKLNKMWYTYSGETKELDINSLKLMKKTNIEGEWYKLSTKDMVDIFADKGGTEVSGLLYIQLIPENGKGVVTFPITLDVDTRGPRIEKGSLSSKNVKVNSEGMLIARSEELTLTTGAMSDMNKIDQINLRTRTNDGAWVSTPCYVSSGLTSIKLKGKDKSTVEYQLEVIDKLGNKTVKGLKDLIMTDGVKSDKIKFDLGAPVIQIKPDANSTAITNNNKTFLKPDAKINISAMDEDSEISSLQVKVNGKEVYKGTSPTYTYTMNRDIDNGKASIEVIAIDGAGNEMHKTSVFLNDTIPPIAPELEFADTLSFGGKQIVDGQIKFRIYASDNKDGSGLAENGVVVKVNDTELKPDKSGYYILDKLPEDMTKFSIELTDLCNNKAIYTAEKTGTARGVFKSNISIADILIDKEAPKLDKLADETGKVANTNWYKGDQVITYVATDDTALKNLIVKSNYASSKGITETFVVNNEGKLTKELRYVLDTSKSKFDSRKGYNLTVSATDLLGKEKVLEKEVFKIDRTAPQITGFVFEGEGIQVDKEPTEINGKDQYGFFMNGDGQVTIQADDTTGENGELVASSGLKRIYYTIYDKDMKEVKELSGSETVQNGSITVKLPTNFKGFIEAYATDTVGYMSPKAKPDGFVNSNTKINPTIIDIELPKTEYKDDRGLALYPSNVKGKVIIHENESGWKDVEWGIKAGEDNKTLGHVVVEKDGTLTGDKTSISKKDRNLVLDMESMLNVDENTNNIEVWVLVTDRRGQKSEKRARFSIDKDRPEIEITFDNTQQGNIYNQDRNAVLKIKERNFEQSDVVIDGATNGIGEWTSEGDIHTCPVYFNKDGDYQLKVKYTDMAGNEAEAKTTEKFTIDKTAPVIKVTYDNNSFVNDNFYKMSRTAMVEITEHNFDPNLIVIEGKGMQGEWQNDGDKHVNTILFAEDGEYEFTVSGKDKANNMLATYQSDKFNIDMTMPTLTIDGVESGVSHKGAISITVSLADTNLNPEQLHVHLSSTKRENIPLKESIGKTTATYVLSNIPTDKDWDDGYLLSASITDMAGNTTAKDISFTVNRHGSQYDVEQSDIMGQCTTILPKEFVFTESSIDPIDMAKTTIEIKRGGEDYNYDPTYLQKDEKKTKQGYEYTYTLDTAGVFKEDGKYNVGVVSQAEDGTKNASVKNNFSFVYDTTAPKIAISGIESGMSYIEDKHAVTVDYDDLSGLEKAVIKVNGVEEDPVVTDQYQKFELAQSEGTYTVTVDASDLAGNTSHLEIQGVRVSNNIWDMMRNLAQIKYLTLLYGGMGIILLIFLGSRWLNRRKIEEEIRKENEQL